MSSLAYKLCEKSNTLSTGPQRRFLLEMKSAICSYFSSMKDAYKSIFERAEMQKGRGITEGVDAKGKNNIVVNM